MKKLFVLMIPVLVLFSCTKESKMQIVEASCGQCQFDMTEKGGCDLAVRIDGQTYFVDNSSLDDHGDAHGEDGLCNTIRKAKVTGEIVESRFKAESFELIK